MDQRRLRLIEAVACKTTVSAQYNGEVMRIAPYGLFERHGELFLAGLNLDKEWRSADERKLGQFKLSGLGEVSLLNEHFDPVPDLRAAPLRAGDSLVLSV